MTGPYPSLRQRALGARLRQLRNERGHSVEDVAGELLCSAAKISRIETGSRNASLRDVRDLCRLYGVADQPVAGELMDLAKQAREPGWWAKYDGRTLAPYISLEQEALAITYFEMYFAPALLQTEEYARALINGIAPGIDQKILDQRVAARLRRQQQLLGQDHPPCLRVLLDEAVVHRQVGGRAVMRAQLARMLRLAAENKATIQIVPFTAGAHAGAESNFAYLEFGSSSLPGIVFVEGLTSNLYLERPGELARYREALDHLRGAALSPRDSVSRIAAVAAGHGRA